MHLSNQGIIPLLKSGNTPKSRWSPYLFSFTVVILQSQKKLKTPVESVSLLISVEARTPPKRNVDSFQEFFTILLFELTSDIIENTS